MLFGRSGYWCWMVHPRYCTMICWPKPQMHLYSMQHESCNITVGHCAITMMGDTDTWSRRAIGTLGLTTYPAWNDQWFQWTYRRLRMPGPSLLLFGWNTVPVTMNLCAWLCRICLVWTFQRNRLISIYLKSFHLSSSDCDSQRLSLGHWHRGSGPGSFDYVILMILMRSGMSSRTLKSSLEYVEQRTPVSQLSQLS